MIPAATLEYEPTPDGRLVALAPPEARARPSIMMPLQQRVADLVVAKFDALTDNERAAYPPAIRRLLARDGELRTALGEFRAQPFRKRTRGRMESVSLRPLRCWGALHEHAYAFCGALTKMTSADREWAFRCERGARACATMTAARPRLRVWRDGGAVVRRCARSIEDMRARARVRSSLTCRTMLCHVRI